jgi:hypothetical protein
MPPPPHQYVRPGQVDVEPPDNCMSCGEPEAAHTMADLLLATDAHQLRLTAQIVLDRAPQRSWGARYIAGFLRRLAEALDRMDGAS